MNSAMKTYLLVLLSLLSLYLCGCGNSEAGIEIGGSLREKEVTKTASKVEGLTISVYLISTKALKGTLVAKALNERGQEIGRATMEINLADDDAKNVSFKFDSKVDAASIKSYLVDLKGVED
jgi:hypothetical protein